MKGQTATKPPERDRLGKFANALRKLAQAKTFEQITVRAIVHQAPGTNDEINTFCVVHYNTAFPRFAKVDVNGDKAAPLFKFLTDNTKFEGFTYDDKTSLMLAKMLSEADPDYAKKSDIKWNFTKFLIGKDGRIVRRFEPTAPLSAIEAEIEKALRQSS